MILSSFLFTKKFSSCKSSSTPTCFETHLFIKVLGYLLDTWVI